MVTVVSVSDAGNPAIRSISPEPFHTRAPGVIDA